MAFQQVPDTALVSTVFELGGERFANTWYYQRSGGYDQTTLQQLADGIDGGPVPGLHNVMEEGALYVGTFVTGLNAINDFSAFQKTATGAAGVGGNRPLPLNVAFVVSRLSGLTGRNARGRVYIGALPATTTYFTGSEYTELSASARAAILAAVDAFRTVTISSPAWEPVIVSRYLNGSKRITAVTFPWTVTAYNSNNVATRRSRLNR